MSAFSKLVQKINLKKEELIGALNFNEVDVSEVDSFSKIAESIKKIDIEQIKRDYIAEFHPYMNVISCIKEVDINNQIGEIMSERLGVIDEELRNVSSFQELLSSTSLVDKLITNEDWAICLVCSRSGFTALNNSTAAIKQKVIGKINSSQNLCDKFNVIITSTGNFEKVNTNITNNTSSYIKAHDGDNLIFVNAFRYDSNKSSSTSSTGYLRYGFNSTSIGQWNMTATNTDVEVKKLSMNGVELLLSTYTGDFDCCIYTLKE